MTPLKTEYTQGFHPLLIPVTVQQSMFTVHVYL